LHVLGHEPDHKLCALGPLVEPPAPLRHGVLEQVEVLGVSDGCGLKIVQDQGSGEHKSIGRVHMLIVEYVDMADSTGNSGRPSRV